MSVRGVEGRDRSASGVGTIRSTGFNAVLVAPDRTKLDSLRALGMRGVVWLGGYTVNGCRFASSDREITAAVSAIAGHRGVLAYYLADRPDLARTQGCPRVADQLRARTALVHSLDPTRRTYITVSAWDGFEAFPYRHFARAADILGLVVYPYAINRSSPSSIDQAIAAADDARIAHYWAVVQDFGDGFYRQPTASELRDELLRWKRSRMEGYFVRDWNAGHLDSKPSHLKVYREANGVAAAASTSSSSSTFAEATTTSTGTADTTAPTTPRNLQATLHSRAVYLTWSASSDNRGVALYRVLRDGQFDGVTALTTFVDFPLPGVRHSYQVSAVDSSGNQSVPAAVSIAVPKTSTEYVGWDVFCSYSNSLKDDPIVKPAQPGASHLHDFFGNKSVTAFSTYSSMSTGGSSCPFADDRAGYWAPALFADGHQVLPGTGRDLLNGHRLQIKVRYFVTAAQAAGVTYSSIPADLRMIVGVSIATTPAENPSLGTEMWWGCSHDEDRALGLRSRTTAPRHCGSGIVSLHLQFPDCWDGVHTDSLDHKSHVAYSDSKNRCPATHPKHLPPVSFYIEYFVGTAWNTITLASGGTSSVHADFWNTWNQSTLDRVVRDCFNAKIWCGAFA